MLITIDAAAPEPLYLQIRNQIVAGIATGQLEPGQSLPSVRSLASDLGINLHTVNKAYAVLRDEGYVTLSPASGDRREKNASLTPAGQTYARALLEPLYALEDAVFARMGDARVAFRARGGARGQFLEAAAAQAARAYGVMEDAEAAPRPVQKRKTAGASSSTGAGKAVAPQ